MWTIAMSNTWCERCTMFHRQAPQSDLRAESCGAFTRPVQMSGFVAKNSATDQRRSPRLLFGNVGSETAHDSLDLELSLRPMATPS